MKTMIVTHESGKTLTYHGTAFELLQYKVRIIENEERRKRLGQQTDDKAVKFEIKECIY